MLRSYTVGPLVVVAALLISGCAPIGANTGALYQPAPIVSRTLSPAEQELQTFLGQAGPGQSDRLALSGDQVLVEAEYQAASGRSCRRARVTLVDGRVQTRVACLEGAGWQLRRPLQGDGRPTLTR